MSLVDKAGEFGQLSAAGLLHEDDLPDVVPVGGQPGGGLDGDQRPAGPEQDGGAVEHLAADRVHHQVGLAGRVVEAVRVQRDETVGAHLGGQLPGPLAPRPDHLRAGPAGQLHRRRSDRAARAVDDHRLSPGQVSVVEQGLPRGQAGPRHRRGVHVVGGARLAGHVARLHGHVLGGRAVAELVGQPEHLVADGDAGRPVSQRSDDSGHLVAGDDRGPLVTGAAGPDRPVELVVRDAARLDLDQHVAEPGPGIGHVFVDKPADACRFVSADGLHRWFPFGPCRASRPDGVFFPQPYDNTTAWNVSGRRPDGPLTGDSGVVLRCAEN
jgi:hypothetical protein